MSGTYGRRKSGSGIKRGAAPVEDDETGGMQSLLDVVTKRFVREGRGSYSRMIIMAKTDGDHGDHSVEVEGIVDSVKHHSKVTGFCLEQLGSLMIVIECDPDILLPFLRGLIKYAGVASEGEESPRLDELRVIASVEDAAKQYFPAFRPLSLTLVKEKDIDMDQEYGDMTAAGTSIHVNIMKIGHTIQETVDEVRSESNRSRFAVSYRLYNISDSPAKRSKQA